MKIKALVIAAALCMTSAVPAFAQHDDDGDRYERQNRYERGDRYDRDHRHYERRDGYRHRDSYRRARGAGPHHDIHAGERLPHAYWGPRYVVRNYHRYGLRTPYQGHRWIRTGDDFVMSSVHTGIVARVALR